MTAEVGLSVLKEDKGSKLKWIEKGIPKLKISMAEGYALVRPVLERCRGFYGVCDVRR